MTAISVNKLNKTYSTNAFDKKQSVLKDLSFSVAKGSVTGFLGANGSGKTTTLKIILGTLFADSGDFKILGESLNENVKNKIGFLPEKPQFPDHLNAKEFLKYQISFYKNIENPKQKIEETLYQVGLSDVGKKKIKNFSKGMMQRLGLAQAILHNPQLIILDEPMSGLDPQGRFEVANIIEKIANLGTTVFFSSHLLGDIQKLCNQVVVIDKGEKLYEGSIEDILQKAKAHYKIIYEEKEELKTETYDDYNSAKERLSQLINNNVFIVEFTRQQSLENAYMELSRESHS